VAVAVEEIRPVRVGVSPRLVPVAVGVARRGRQPRMLVIVVAVVVAVSCSRSVSAFSRDSWPLGGDVGPMVTRARDRKGGAETVRFSSAILPPYLRRSKSIEDLLPWLYLKGVSTGDFGDALASLLGSDAPGLSSERAGQGIARSQIHSSRRGAPLDSPSARAWSRPPSSIQ